MIADVEKDKKANPSPHGHYNTIIKMLKEQLSLIDNPVNYGELFYTEYLGKVEDLRHEPYDQFYTYEQLAFNHAVLTCLDRLSKASPFTQLENNPMQDLYNNVTTSEDNSMLISDILEEMMRIYKRECPLMVNTPFDGMMEQIDTRNKNLANLKRQYPPGGLELINPVVVYLTAINKNEIANRIPG